MTSMQAVVFQRHLMELANQLLLSCYAAMLCNHQSFSIALSSWSGCMVYQANWLMLATVS